MDVGINEKEHNRIGQHRRGTAKSSNLKRINLALQGGGSHGAFAWGVLDRLLEDDSIDFDGISATSVGAVNATVLACGLAVGGRAGARHALADFWCRVANLASLSPLQPTPFDRLTGNQWLETSPFFVQFDLMTRLFSPYQLNPFNINPLRSILCDTVDFDALRNAYRPIKLFLPATNVRTGKMRIFQNDEMDLTQSWLRLVYRFCSRQSKSTVSIIGMVGIWATRQSFPSSITVTAETW
jgi:NTE family protein